MHPNTPLIESSNSHPHHHQSERDILISECLALIDHPLLSSPQHPILDDFKDFIQSGLKFNRTKPSLSKLLYSLIFQDKSPQQLHEFYASKQLSFDAVCSKIIAKNVAFYMCLDCDKLRKNDSALVCCLCKECFKASNHIGHRVLLSLNDDTTSSACDCGDSSVFDSAGFCKAHSQKSVSLDSIIEGIGLETVQKFRDNMSAAFYGLFSLIEISQGLAVLFQAEAGKVLKIRDIFTEVIHVIISSVINLLEFLIAKVNSSFILIIADFLQSSLSEANNLLKHNCSEYHKPIYTPGEAPHQCSCPIIELLLKYISSFTPVFQENLISFCNTMSKSEEFKSYMATIFMKTLYFSFYQDEPKHRERELYSKFAKANVHYYTNVDLCGKVVKEPYISNLFSLVHDVIEVNKEPKVYFPPLIWELKSMIKCMLRPNSESCSTLLKDRKASVAFLEEAVHNANIHSYPGPIFVDMTYEDINLFYISQVLGVSGMLESLVKRCLCQLQELAVEDAEAIYQETTMKWQELYVDFVKNQPAAAEITFLSTIERLANYLIRGWDLNLQKQKTQKFFQEISQNTGFTVPTIASQLLKGTLKQMGAIRRIYLIDPKCRREIGAMYLNDEYTLIDADVTSIQMFLPWSPSENLFQDLLKSWFQYAPEVSEILLTGSYDKLTKNQLMVLNDFFGFLVFFMIDEICSLKLKLTKDPRNYLEEVDFTQDLNRVTRRVLINLLAGKNWVDINDVKESVKHMLWDSSIEDVLPKLADKDEKTNKVRLREEYYNEVDPFLFSHKRILQKDLLDSLQGTDQKKVKVDPISGVYYTDLPEYCYEAQRAMFEGSLPEFLGTFVTKYNSTIESIDTLLRPVLRLILTHLQAINHLKNDVGTLEKNLEHYLTEEFQKSLKAIRHTETMSDFVLAIDKIFNLLKIYMKQQDHKEEKTTQDEQEENLAEKKKKLAQQKMKELKEKFAQKQKNFMNQMSSELQEETVAVVVTEEAKEDNQSVACTLCLHKIDTSNELYGFPCYINFASRLMIAGKDLDLQNQHFPALHGCGHLFHAKCFLDWKAKTHQPTGPHQILLNIFESFCPLCSNLVNEFCPLNQKEGAQDEEGAAKKLQIDVNNRIIKRLGVLKEYIETNDEAVWRENNPKLVEEFARNGVRWLRNMYVLFFEGFELNSFDRFYKKFQVYADFLSCVKRQASFDIKFFEEIQSNKDDLKTLTQEASLMIDILFIVLYGNSENKKEEILARLSKYIEAKIEQGLKSFSEEVLLDKQKKLDSLQNILNDEQFLKEYMPVLQKALMIYALVLYEEGSKEEGRKIVENLFNHKTDTYFSCFKVNSFADFISDNITENLDSLKEAPEGCKYLVPTALKPKRVELPQNYQLFVDKYMNHKCAFCRDLPSHGEKIVCLLCGEVLCRTRCSTKTKFSNVKLGNANIHSVYEHNGGGMFLEVHLLGMILVNFPKNMITSRNIYVDESGLSINNLTFNAFDKRLDTIDYKKFVLDVETIKYISGIVENYLIPLEQFQNAKNNKSKLYVEGVL